MILKHSYWSKFFAHKFAPELSAIADTLTKRVLPAFDRIDEEAEAKADKAWGDFMSSPGSEDDEHADFADAADEVGVSHYLLLDGVRQGMINLFGAALYHAFEQQVKLFHHKELLHPREESDRSLIEWPEFKRRPNALGIDIATLPSSSKVDELRLVANTAKHAEGGSAQKLHALRPDLFEPPESAGYRSVGSTAAPQVFQPLLGKDLYVSLDDFQEYLDACLGFWRELALRMKYA